MQHITAPFSEWTLAAGNDSMGINVFGVNDFQQFWQQMTAEECFFACCI
jgi:hypothetical protein